MDRLKQLLVEGFVSIVGLVRSTKEAYDGANRFARMRLAILAFLVVDLVVVVGFMSSIGSRALELTVFFKKSFPSNMLVVRNESGEAMTQVRFTLDNRYVLTVPSLAPGLHGFEVNRVFMDPQELPPEESYTPKVVVVETDGERMTLDVSREPGS